MYFSRLSLEIIPSIIQLANQNFYYCLTPSHQSPWLSSHYSFCKFYILFVGLVVLMSLSKKRIRSSLSWSFFWCHIFHIFLFCCIQYCYWWFYYYSVVLFSSNSFFPLLDMIPCWLFIYIVLFPKIFLSTFGKICLIIENYNHAYSNLLKDSPFFPKRIWWIPRTLFLNGILTCQY